MFKPDPRSSYMMPAHFGPRHMGPKSSGWYHDVTAIVVPYVTDREILAQYIPEPFSVAEEALLTVYYACNRNVDWLAGHGYNMIGVNAAVTYESNNETLEGTYALVIWENLTDPILTGRELQGIPKIYADIPDHSIIGDEWRCNASHFGHKILDLMITDVNPVAMELVEGLQAQNAGKDNPMGVRYIPALGGFGTQINQPTLFPSQNDLREVLTGTGSVTWNRLSWEQNPTQYHIVNALADLPVLEQRSALVTKGSTNLIVMDRLPRPLT